MRQAAGEYRNGNRGIRLRRFIELAETARIVYLIYAAWLIVGGILGYTQSAKPSIVSLIAGTVTGALMLGAAALLGRTLTTGLTLGLVTTLLVLGSFVPRFLRSPSFYPGGLTILLSAVALAVTVAALLAARQAAGR